jgi:hypothetical protein
MELTYLLTWIGAVGLVTLATSACFSLLKHGQRLEDAEREIVAIFAQSQRPKPGVNYLGRFISSATLAIDPRGPIEIRSSLSWGGCLRQKTPEPEHESGHLDMPISGQTGRNTARANSASASLATCQRYSAPFRPRMERETRPLSYQRRL